MPALTLSPVATLKLAPIYTFVATADTLWAGGMLFGDGALHATTDGRTFTRGKHPSLYAWYGSSLLTTDDGELIAAGDNGIARSRKRGQAWAEPHVRAKLYTLLRAQDGTIWAGGQDSVWWSGDAGKTWKRAGTTKQPIFAFVENDQGELLALGEGLTPVKKSGLGATKRFAKLVRAVARAPGGLFVAVGHEGLVLVSRDARTWKPVKAPTKANLYTVRWYRDAFVIGGTDSTLLSLDATARTFSRIAVPGPAVHVETTCEFQGQLFVGGELALAAPVAPGTGLVFTDGTVQKAKPRKAGAKAEPKVATPADFRAFAKGPRDETALQAIARYERFYAAITKSNVIADAKLWREDHALQVVGKPIAAPALDAAERKLGLRLPPSYRAFVRKRGLIAFGSARTEARMFHPAKWKSLDQWIASNWKLDPAKDLELDEPALARLRGAFAFSHGDPDLQLVWFYAFRSDVARAGELAVIPFDQDEMSEAALPVRGAWDGFDRHMSRLVTEKITTALEWIEEGRYVGE